MNIAQPTIKALTLALTFMLGGQDALADQTGGKKQLMKTQDIKGQVSQSLVILSSSSLQTQGMAMVLSNTMAASGAHVNVLLCDTAGDLALKENEKESKDHLMKPKNVSPKMLLNKLKSQGATVNVCALYLPNSQYTKADLMEGVGVAKPPEIASMMSNRQIRVFNF